MLPAATYYALDLSLNVSMPNTSSVGGSLPHNNMQPYYVVNFYMNIEEIPDRPSVSCNNGEFHTECPSTNVSIIINNSLILDAPFAIIRGASLTVNGDLSVTSSLQFQGCTGLDVSSEDLQFQGCSGSINVNGDFSIIPSGVVQFLGCGGHVGVKGMIFLIFA